ncbi:hypothetical protein IQ22_03834 [Pseudomonas duriflava]|uniref:Uncharacterized protein n=1 Tax=Pseudomonas duriflava TaxID=459528 RepID=A0A562Q1A2_9PSED|nr:hypothetical protein [Pseudomonas duriflava]TWI50444.1 hypothetical protein IQ22_03834 [Pseudomonas duriflava]
MSDLASLSNDELAQRIFDTLTDTEAAALGSACMIANALGHDRPDVKTARTCCELVGEKPDRLMAFLGYVPLKGHPNGWVNVEKGSNGPGLVGSEQSLGLFVFRQLGGVFRANLRSNQSSKEQ